MDPIARKLFAGLGWEWRASLGSGDKEFLGDMFSKGSLVGGLEHFSFSHILVIIVPTD